MPDTSSQARIRRIWKNIHTRCYNHNSPKYLSYGARGIQMCDGWKHFINFKAWSLQSGYADNLTIDRIDNNGNYEPSNCRWVSQKDQQNNRTNNFIIEYMGETKTLSQWCDKLGLSARTVQRRISTYHFPIEKAFKKGDLRYGREPKHSA